MTTLDGWLRRLTAALLASVVIYGLGVTTVGTAAAQVPAAPVTLTADDGASATCTVQVDLTSIACDLVDTKPDRNPVFIQWAIDDDETRWNNTNGSNPQNNSKSFSEGGLNENNAAQTISWRVCVDKQLRGDTCSGAEVVKGVNRPLEFVCPPPSPSIPPDLQDPPTCYPVEPDPRFSELDKCALGIGLAIVGVADESGSSASKAKEIVRQGGQVTLKKLGPIGWGLTIAGVSTAIAECNP